MAMENVSELFCGNPETFMRDNVVIQKIMQQEPGLISVVVYADTSLKVGNRSGGKVCVMAKAKPNQTPALPAYWCPYEQNELRSAMLGDDALFAFTPTMDGCSIGLGSATGTGAQLLCHVNAARVGGEWSAQGTNMETGRARQSQSQEAQLRYKLGPGATVINPLDYRPDGHGDHAMSSTTYGVHALGKPWKLYTLTYRAIGAKTFFHGGVSAHG